MEKQYITRRELADKLSISNQTIRRFERQGMPSLQVGSYPRYNLEEVLAWIQSQQDER